MGDVEESVKIWTEAHSRAWLHQRRFVDRRIGGRIECGGMAYVGSSGCGLT